MHCCDFFSNIVTVYTVAWIVFRYIETLRVYPQVYQ